MELRNVGRTISAADSSIYTAMFITVTRSEEKCFITVRMNHKNWVCGHEYFGIHIIASACHQPSKFQDFPGPTLLSRTFEGLEILQKKFQDFPLSVGTLLPTLQNRYDGTVACKMWNCAIYKLCCAILKFHMHNS